MFFSSVLRRRANYGTRVWPSSTTLYYTPYDVSKHITGVCEHKLTNKMLNRVHNIFDAVFKYSAQFPMPTGHLARAINVPNAKLGVT